MIKILFLVIMLFFSNLVFANNITQTASSMLNISLMVTNICVLHITDKDIDFGVVSVNELRHQHGNIIPVPITVTCTGNYKNENISLSFKPLGENGHFGLPSSGILNTTTKNIGILLTTYGDGYSKNNNISGNNIPLIFYSPYIMPSGRDNNSFTINAQPIIENTYSPIKSGKFSAGMVVTLTYD